MTFEAAKSRAYSMAFAVFFRCMRRLSGEAGIARLANSGPDEHMTLVSTGDGRMFTVHVTVKCGPIVDASDLDAILDPPTNSSS